MNRHSLTRTSPKGVDFIGTCTQCGSEGVTMEDFKQQECPVTFFKTARENDMLNAIKGPEPSRTPEEPE